MAITFFYTDKALFEATVNTLTVTAIHSTQDMSVANSTEISKFYTLREVKAMIGGRGVVPISECAPWQVVSISEDEVVLSWQR